MNERRDDPPCGRGTVVSIVSCPCTYCCLETRHGKINIIHDIVLWHFATWTGVNFLTCVLVLSNGLDDDLTLLLLDIGDMKKNERGMTLREQN